MENKTFNFFRFEDLRVYHKALDYSSWINALLKDIEPGAVQNQFARSFSKSATCIAVNIAEGSVRNKGQFVQYLKLAKSHVRECVVFTTVGLNGQFFDNDKYEESRSFLIEISKMVGALITSLQKGKSKDENEDFDEHPETNDLSTARDDEFDL